MVYNYKVEENSGPGYFLKTQMKNNKTRIFGQSGIVTNEHHYDPLKVWEVADKSDEWFSKSIEKRHFLGPIPGHKIYLKNPKLSLFHTYVCLTLCKISLLQTNRRMDGRTNGQC